ncbi:hypothetical protein MBLNU230_g1155t1 [Neophaeotheca triangularis]
MTTPTSPTKAEESATTREEMDFDDSEQSPEQSRPQAQETGKLSPAGNETPSRTPPKRVSFQDEDEEAPPSKPPRPMSPNAQAENTLIEAFPSIDSKVVKAVLTASGGKVEPAFNALLGMSDPNFKPEEAAPPQPPRPTVRQPQTQMEQDEMYARQLAEHFNSTSPPSRGQAHYNQRDPAARRPNQQRPSYTEDDREHSFFDDDLPEISRNIQQGFAQTQKTVNGWLNNLKKRIDGEDEDEDLYSGSKPARSGSGQFQGRQNFGPSQSEQLYGIRRSADASRRSVEASRNYDADPHELDDATFQRLELRDEEAPPPQPPRRSGSRGAANPDLFKPQPRPPQSGPVDEVDAIDRKLAEKNDPNGGNGKKWQSLTSVAPHPEDDNDPFSLGDDDDEKEKGEDTRKADSERLKEKARASVSAGAGGEESKGLQPSERSRSGSTKDQTAEDLLAGKTE